MLGIYKNPSLFGLDDAIPSHTRLPHPQNSQRGNFNPNHNSLQQEFNSSFSSCRYDCHEDVTIPHLGATIFPSINSCDYTYIPLLPKQSLGVKIRPSEYLQAEQFYKHDVINTAQLSKKMALEMKAHQQHQFYECDCEINKDNVAHGEPQKKFELSSPLINNKTLPSEHPASPTIFLKSTKPITRLIGFFTRACSSLYQSQHPTTSKITCLTDHNAQLRDSENGSSLDDIIRITEIENGFSIITVISTQPQTAILTPPPPPPPSSYQQSLPYPPSPPPFLVEMDSSSSKGICQEKEHGPPDMFRARDGLPVCIFSPCSLNNSPVISLITPQSKVVPNSAIVISNQSIASRPHCSAQPVKSSLVTTNGITDQLQSNININNTNNNSLRNSFHQSQNITTLYAATPPTLSLFSPSVNYRQLMISLLQKQTASSISSHPQPSVPLLSPPHAFFIQSASSRSTKSGHASPEQQMAFVLFAPNSSTEAHASQGHKSFRLPRKNQISQQQPAEQHDLSSHQPHNPYILETILSLKDFDHL